MVLEGSESIKLLGMYLYEALTPEDHNANFCLKATSGIFVLRNLAKAYSPEVLWMALFLRTLLVV